ncbi:NAD(P)H-binding protein [Streptomyces sp. NPDC085639]|uniref:NAD(P)H-binding protein n=1 Tax=Streptomyces sp. NPDC085639 TaxID=3365734 RepID=UPI0037D34ED5
MQLTVLGATGPIGQQVLQQALTVGHRVTALVRDAARLPQRDDERVTVVIGDAAPAAEVVEAARGARPSSVPWDRAAKLVTGALRADKGIADETIARSHRDWTIALPVMFADGPTTAG